jgi:opacity protein-like surface antigen
MEWEVPMRKILTAAMAALTLGGAVAATAVPAQAEPHWHGGGGWHGGWHGGGWRGDDDAGLAIAAGVLGLAAGAAIASDHPHYYGGYYGRPAYYAPDPYYDGGYETCVSHRRVWDPYYGGYVVRSFRYAC